MTAYSDTQKRIRRLNFVRLSFFTLLFTFIISALIIIKGLFITLILAFVFSFLLAPLVNILCKWGFSRGAATPLVFFSVLGFVAGFLTWTFPFLSQQFVNLREEFPTYVEKTTLLITTWQEQLESHLFFMKNLDVATNLENLLHSLGTAFLQDLPSIVAQSFTILLLAPFFTYFMIRNELGLTRHLYPLVPNQLFELFLGLHYKIRHQIGVFIRGRLLEAFIVGLIVGTSLLVFKFPFAILLAVFAALANLVPYVGPMVASVVIFLVAIVNGYETSNIVIVLGIFYFTQIIDSMILVPMFLARIVNLHPLTVIVIILAGAQFMGVLGMIISIPLANALSVSVMAVYNHMAENV